jgi:hypothetical protein
MKYKSPLGILAAAALGFACAYGLFQQSLKQQQDEFAKKSAAWQTEKINLESALASAKGRTTTLRGETKIVEVTKRISPAEILERLKTLKVVADQPRTSRLLVHQFEMLIETGPAALPVIREFLARNQDVDYDGGGQGRNSGSRGSRMPPADFNVPPSLRLGLFEALKDIGGADAEKILADALGTTGRGIELAYLARALQELSPDKYRTAALAAAHELLAHPLADAADKTDHNYLFATLAFLNDPSSATEAQAQLIQPDGKVDMGALRYLQQTAGDKSVAIAMQAYQDPRITDPKSRERVAQVALDKAGIDPMADNFIRAVFADTSLPADNRNNLAQDYADHGTNPKNPSAQDLQTMQNRLAQLETLMAEATDPVVLAGLAEAKKDLIKFINDYIAQHPAH